MTGDDYGMVAATFFSRVVHKLVCFYNFCQPCNSSLIKQQRHGRLQNEEEKDCIHYRQMSTTFCFALEACMYVYWVWNERKKFNDNFSFSFILLCVFFAYRLIENVKRRRRSRQLFMMKNNRFMNIKQKIMIKARQWSFLGDFSPLFIYDRSFDWWKV